MSELRFDGRVAVVTGGGRGLGRAHALLLASRGARVVVNDLGVAMDGHSQAESPAEEVAQEICRMGGKAIADVGNIATEEGANGLIQSAMDAFGRVDVVVHNAGICTFVPFAEMTYAQYREVVSVSQDGAFLIAKAAWPHMTRQGYGRFVFISSLAQMAKIAHYAAAKASLVGFVRSLAAEGAGNNIRSNTLSVMAYTRMMGGYFDRDSGHTDMGLFGQEAIHKWWQDNLLPEQVSAVVGWLGHESCDLSGETLYTAGGHVSRQFIGLSEGYANAGLTPELVAANRETIMALGENFNIFGTPGRESWMFDRITAGGAPKLPAMSDPS